MDQKDTACQITSCSATELRGGRFLVKQPFALGLVRHQSSCGRWRVPLHHLFCFFFLFTLPFRLSIAWPMNFFAFALTILSPNPAARMVSEQLSCQPGQIHQSFAGEKRNQTKCNLSKQTFLFIDPFVIYQPTLLKAADTLPFRSMLTVCFSDQGSMPNLFYLV